ncbi:TIGR02444 family protein [Roseixanthobacter glucoisosaccharinicivorans]|uniref:TIGR02444 family protein n=1 Tax=Roseixanthobacter glucoisosaccharinicivorans TaxID=3119923 RepID=UPI00372C2CE0
MSDQSLKAFALDLYGRAGVAPACLRLQEKTALNVNLLLFAAWFGACLRRELSPQTAAAAQERVEAWHREIVLPLRAVRRRLKTGPHPAPTAQTGALRGTVQGVEIGAELIELEELEAFAHTLDTGPSPAAPEPLARAAMLEVVALTAGRGADGPERTDIALILSACFAPQDPNPVTPSAPHSLSSETL